MDPTSTGAPTRTLKPSKADATGPAQHAGKTVGQAASARETLIKVLQDQLRLPKYARLARTETAEGLGDAMLACLTPPELDFRSLSARRGSLMGMLPPAVWTALRQQALAQSNCEITSVTLSPALSAQLVEAPSHTLLAGMGQLPGLRHLTIVDPPAGLIDLAPQGAMPEGLANIQVMCDGPPQKWELHVPRGANVYATANGPSAEKSTVYFHDCNGHVGEPRTLAGVIHDHQFGNLNLPAQPRDIALNGVAPLRGAVSASDVGDGKIWCRHLAHLWLRARRENRSADQATDYSRFADVATLSEDVDPGTMNEVLRIHIGGVEALFAAENFGALLAQQFDHMRVGQTRQYLIETSDHVLAFELRVKTAEPIGGGAGPVEYVVNFYDPNLTAMHERLVVLSSNQLRGKGLGAWTAELSDYFPANEGPAIAALYPWFEKGQAKPPPLEGHHLEHVPRELWASPLVMFNAMEEGRIHVVREILELAMQLLKDGKLDGRAFEQCLSAENMKVTGLTAALVMGRFAIVEEFVRWILERPASVLSAEKQLVLLRASGRDGMPGLYLLAVGPPDESPNSARPDLLDEINQSVFSYVHAIAASRDLSTQDKATLCAAAFEGNTSAQAALATNKPTIAAAMACAIFEGESDLAPREALLRSLGVTPREVLAALGGRPYPKLADWIAIAEGATGST